MARELAGTGASVLILESGGLQPGPEAQRLARGSSTGEPFLPLDRVRIRAVGGTSRHWLPLDTKDVRGAGVRMARLDATDFERLERVPYSGWPLSLDELEPFYERAESFLGLRVGDYGWEGLFEPGQAPDIGQRMEFLLIQMADPDIFYREARKLAALPRMTLITEATVLKVEYEHTRTRAVSALVTSPEGREFRVEAGFFVLAGGGIENARLLLLSSSAGGAMPANDNIGRFFMEHPALNTRAALFPAGAIFRPREHNGSRLLLTAGIRQEVRERQGLLQISLVADPATAALGSASGLSLARLYHAYQTRKVPDGALRDIARILRSPATSFSAGMGYVRNRWDGTDVFRLAVKLEQAPNPESRVVLSRKRDRFGQPKAELRWRLSAAEWQTFAAATRIVEEDFRGLGYKQISDESAAPPARVALISPYGHDKNERRSQQWCRR